MSEPLSTSQLEYFGISPYLSSENALARFSWGLADREIKVSEIETAIARGHSPVVIPSHFWWRQDATEILSACQNHSSKVSFQIGPGFELKTHLSLARLALKLGYRLQILIQASLTSEQKNRLQGLTQNFAMQVELLFLWQETQEDPSPILDELRELGVEKLALGLTRRNWSQIYAELKKEKLQQLPVYDFEQGRVCGLEDILEQTNLAQRTKKFRSSQFDFPIKEVFRFLSHLFLLILAPGKKSLNLFRESAKTVVKNLYWSLIQKVYWDFLFQIYNRICRRFFVHLYWKIYGLTNDVWGRMQALKVNSFWFFHSAFHSFYQWCKDYPFWPVRKIYWFSKYQYEKRILRK